MSGLSKDFDIPSVASISQEGQENRTLKVTLLSSEWRSLTDGDLSTINRELAIQLAKHSNVEVSVFLPQCSEEDRNNAESHDVRLVVAETLPGMNPVDCLMVVPDGHAMDCVIGHGVTLGKQVQVIRKHHHCKWIQVVHTAPEELGMYKSISQGEQLQKTEVALCKKADQVVAIGPKLADTYKRYFCHSNKEQNVLEVIPGIFSEFLDVEQATEERRTFRVLVIGSADCCEDFILKGFDLAAQAIAELKDKSYQLKFVGAPRERGDELADKFLQHGIDHNQLLIHSLSDNREVLADILCEVDLAIMPYKTEGFGVNALEALSAGLPVLVSGNSGFGEALKEVLFGSECVIDSEDPKDWAREIKAVRQKKRSKRLTETKLVREKYLEMYSWEKSIGSLVERMHSLIFGLKSRPVIATGDERPTAPVLGDDYSKEFRGKPIHCDHHEALKGSSGGQLSQSSMKYGQCPVPSTSVTQYNLVQEGSHTQSSEGRPVTATRDKRSPSSVFGDHHSKQLRGGQLLYCDLYEALKDSSGGHSSHSSMDYGQRPLPSATVTQEEHVQQRTHTQVGSEGRPVIATSDKRPPSTVFGDHHSKQFRGGLLHFDHYEGSSGSHSSNSCMECGQSPFPTVPVTQDKPGQQRNCTQGSESRPLIATGDKRPSSSDFRDHNSKRFKGRLIKYDHLEGSSGGYSSHSSTECGQSPLPSASVTQGNPVQERSHTQDYPEQLVELIRREYEGAVLFPFPWCEDELEFELAKIFTRLMIVAREKERKRLTDDLVKMTEVFRALKRCDCKCECKCEGKKPRVVLIEGPPGMGKTTYCQKLAYDWSVGDIASEPSFPEVDMFLMLTCRDMMTANIEDAIDDQLLPIDVDKKDKEKFFYFIRHNQTRILLVLDGLDELPKKLFEEFMPLITGRVFPLTYVMLTARHEAGMKVRRHCDALFEIVGYTKEDADDYITKYFSSHEKPILARKLITEIDRDSQLRELTASALNTALLCLVFEDKGGVLPYNRTMLYFELVSCVLRRYCSKREISLDYQDPVKKYTDHLNQLGELALGALLKDQLSFTFEELKSHSTEFLELGFLSRQASASRIKPKPSYAFIHKTFQEYFAAFHLAHELTTDRDKAALLAQLTPVDKYWQVWTFLITMAASESDDTAVFLVSSICAAFQHQKLDQFFNRPYAQQAEDRDDKWSKSDGNSLLLERASLQSRWCDENDHKDNTEEKTIIPFYLDGYAQEEDNDDDSSRGSLFSLFYEYNDDVCRGVKYNWALRSHWPFRVSRESSFVVKIVEAISQCERPNTGLKPYQIKMAGTLARCFPIDKISVSSYNGIPLNFRFPFVMSEFLNGNCKLIELIWGLGVLAAAALANVLKTSHTLTHLHLTNGSCITSITPALQANHTVTHLNMHKTGVGDVEAKALGTVLQSNHTLTHLCLADNKISHIGVKALAEALKFNRVLEDLNIGQNDIGDEGAVALSQALESNRTLRCLNMSGGMSRERIGDEGLRAMANSLRCNSSLTYLDIDGHGFSDSSVAELGKAHQSNCPLTHLYVGGALSSLFPAFPFGDSSAEAFSKALQSRDTQLTCLDLRRTSMGLSRVIILAESLRVNSTLERLDLSQNHIGCPGAVALARALKINQTLTHLQLRSNLISDDGVKEFVEVLQCNKTLMFLGLMKNPMTNSGRDLFKVLGGQLELDESPFIVFTRGAKWTRNL